MKVMERNKQDLYYCLLRGTGENDYGEEIVSYEKAKKMRASVSAAYGESQVEVFGNDVSYDRVIVTDDMSCPIDEDTVLFVDKAPEYSKDTGYPLYDYQVRGVARSLNHISYAVSKVVVS